MKNLSKSTKLLNCLVALSTKTPDFPHPLWENGFQVENIEPRILLSNKLQAQPDIQLKKNENHVTFFECKDGHCEKDQLERYKKMTIADIVRAHVTSLPSAGLTFDLGYFGTKEKEEKLVASIEKDANPFPIIILDKDCIRLSGDNHFKNDTLNSIFREIQFNKNVPQSFIPFTVDDDDETISIFILQHLVTKMGKSFTIDVFIAELFSQVIHLYSTEGKTKLKERIGRLINDIIRDPDVSEFIYRHGTEYTVKEKGLKKFRNVCLKLIKRYEEEQNKAKNSLLRFPDIFTENLGNHQ